ncbi:TPA: hypothetical protein ACH3X1_006440 [Trebouxia sp. C0004]
MGRQNLKTGLVHLLHEFHAQTAGIPKSGCRQPHQAVLPPVRNSREQLNVPQLSQQAVAHLYGKGLAAAADLLTKAVELDTKRPDKQQSGSWQTGCKASRLHATGLTVTAEDILVHFTQHWLLNHAEPMTADGELIAAPGSLPSTKPHLYSAFAQLGRNDDWGTAN